MSSKFQTRFDHRPVRLSSKLPSRVRSEFRDECDIRNIIARHSILPSVAPAFVDMTLIPAEGPQGILEFARRVAADFDSLPLKARQRFNYDSEALVSFLLDGNNRDEAVSLGLVAPAPTHVTTTEPVTTEVINEK